MIPCDPHTRKLGSNIRGIGTKSATNLNIYVENFKTKMLLRKLSCSHATRSWIGLLLTANISWHYSNMGGSFSEYPLHISIVSELPYRQFKAPKPVALLNEAHYLVVCSFMYVYHVPISSITFSTNSLDMKNTLSAKVH